LSLLVFAQTIKFTCSKINTNRMKTICYLLLISLIASSCSDSIQTAGSQASSNDSLSADSNAHGFANSPESPELKPIPQTHLKDTTFIKGSYVLFLRPDDLTFKSYEADENPGIYEIDSDFGFAMAATMDTLANNRRYKNIKTDISTARYIVIQDCKNGPFVFDRDSINYGLILTSKAKAIQLHTLVHSGDYLEEVDDYFNLKK
jgi:hypothetical protein